jgi:hypothetical protein
VLLGRTSGRFGKRQDRAFRRRQGLGVLSEVTRGCAEAFAPFFEGISGSDSQRGDPRGRRRRNWDARLKVRETRFASHLADCRGPMGMCVERGGGQKSPLTSSGRRPPLAKMRRIQKGVLYLAA